MRCRFGSSHPSTTGQAWLATATERPLVMPRTARSGLRRPAASIALVGALAATLAGALLGAAAPAAAVGGGSIDITVVGDDAKSAVADTSAPTKLSLSGSGFQSIEGGFGGIYVLFGWVAGDGWEPSAGGESGVTYRYVTDDPNAPAGYQLFVPFPGSSTAAEGNGGTVAADGTWSAELTIAGPSFSPVDADGTGETIDCREVQCGIITFGAHGVVNPANESFTPIAFEDFSAPVETATPDASEPAAPAETEQAVAAAADSSPGAAPLVVALGTAVVVIGGVTAAIVATRRRKAAAAGTAAAAPADERDAAADRED